MRSADIVAQCAWVGSRPLISDVTTSGKNPWKSISVARTILPTLIGKSFYKKKISAPGVVCMFFCSSQRVKEHTGACNYI